MQKFLDFIAKHKGKGIVALVLAALAALLLSSCSTARLNTSGTVVTDKHSEKQYEVQLEK